MRAPIGLNACKRVLDVHVTVDDEVPVDDDCGNVCDAKAPGFSDVLVCAPETVLKFGATCLQALSGEARGLLGIGGELCGQLGLQTRRGVEQNDARPCRRHNGVMRVGNDEHVRTAGRCDAGGQRCAGSEGDRH